MRAELVACLFMYTGDSSHQVSYLLVVEKLVVVLMMLGKYPSTLLPGFWMT